MSQYIDKKESIVTLIVGIILFVSGVKKLFFNNPDVGINLATQQPVVANGTIYLILGIGAIIAGVINLKGSKKK